MLELLADVPTWAWGLIAVLALSMTVVVYEARRAPLRDDWPTSDERWPS